MNHILIIGAQHGDERLGHKLYRHLMLARHNGKYRNVDFICGNPKAYRANKRFIETDLNRSYAVERPQTYEEKRAAKLLQKIARGKYDYVLDIHTSRSDCGMFAISANMDKRVQEVLRANIMNRIAVMPSHIAGGSLIGNVPGAVSLEYARTIASSRHTLASLVKLIDNLSAGAYEDPAEREVFYVQGTIESDVPIDKDSKNFEKCNLGFYPVIFRHKGGSYTAHKGFYALEKRNIVL